MSLGLHSEHYRCTRGKRQIERLFFAERDGKTLGYFNKPLMTVMQLHANTKQRSQQTRLKETAEKKSTPPSLSSMTKLAVELIAALGILFRAATLLFSALAGMTLPSSGIDVQRWTPHGADLYDEHIATITAKLKNKRSLIHDSATN